MAAMLWIIPQHQSDYLKYPDLTKCKCVALIGDDFNEIDRNKWNKFNVLLSFIFFDNIFWFNNYIDFEPDKFDFWLIKLNLFNMSFFVKLTLVSLPCFGEGPKSVTLLFCYLQFEKCYCIIWLCCLKFNISVKSFWIFCKYG